MRRILAGCRGAEARIVAAEARLLHAARAERLHEVLGFAALSCFAREELKVDVRTARDRIVLHEILARSPALRAAFLTGRVSTGHLLALRWIVRRAASLSGGESAPGGKPHPGPMEEMARWIALAERLSVRAFRLCVREAETSAGTMEESEEEDDAEQVVVQFEAPLMAARAWDVGIDTARRRLGRSASMAECVEAILIEAAPGAVSAESMTTASGGGGDSDGTGSGGRSVIRNPLFQGARPHAEDTPAVRLTGRWRRRLQSTLAGLESSLWEIEVGEEDPPVSAQAWLCRWRALRALRGGLEARLHRTLADLRASGLMIVLGYARLADLVEAELGYSPRGARHLVAVLNLRDAAPALARAASRGAIGSVSAFLIARHVPAPSHERWALRAASVSVRQLERELQFLERCTALDQGLGARLAGAWPAPGRIGEFAAELARRAVDDPSASHDALVDEAGPFGPRAGDAANDFHPAEDGAGDPAAQPELLRHLEALLDEWEARNHRREMARPEKSPLVRLIRFRLPGPLARAWSRALHMLAPLPTWAAAVLLVDRATGIWVARHRDAPPVEDRILERDDYQCQAPGCGARDRLEVHHIVPRARGGTHDAGNRITLCHWHHHRGIHGGRIRLTGEAPDRLCWEMPLGRWIGALRARVSTAGRL